MKHLLLLTLVALLSCNDNKSGDPDNDEDSTSNENIAPQQRTIPVDTIRIFSDTTKSAIYIDTLR
jgi:hypothetical protein